MTSGGTNVPTMAYPNGGRSNIEMHYGVDENGNSMSDRDWIAAGSDFLSKLDVWSNHDGPYKNNS